MDFIRWLAFPGTSYANRARSITKLLLRPRFEKLQQMCGISWAALEVQKIRKERAVKPVFDMLITSYSKFTWCRGQYQSASSKKHLQNIRPFLTPGRWELWTLWAVSGILINLGCWWRYQTCLVLNTIVPFQYNPKIGASYRRLCTSSPQLYLNSMIGGNNKSTA